MICVSIAESSVAGVVEAVDGVDFAEVRLDAIENITGEKIKEIFSLPKTLVATYRQRQNEVEILKAAIEAGASWVDVEVEMDDHHKEEIVTFAKERGCKVIVSFHDYERTPVEAELEHVINWCFDSGADIAKVACKVNSNQDNARLLGLLDDERRILLVGMGAQGRVTRVLAPWLGSPFTFVAKEKGKETAEGQLSLEEMLKLMEAMQCLKT